MSLKMEVNCSNDTDYVMQTSLEILASVSTPYWVTFGLGLLGILNNSLLLYMFYRLKWFSETSIILFWNLAIVDLLCCSTTTIAVSYTLFHHVAGIPNISKAIVCESLYFWPTVLNNISDRMALGIAIDRLLIKLFPMKWFTYGPKFRWGAVVICWMSGLVQPTITIFKEQYDQCILACFTYTVSGQTNTFTGQWYHHFVFAVNLSINVLIIFIYVVIPTLAAIRIKICFRQVSDSGVFVLGANKLEDRVQSFLSEIRRLSFFYIICFLCSEFSAIIVCDTLTHVFHSNLFAKAFVSSVCNLCIMLNSIYHLYIWLLSEKFRKALFEFFAHILCLNLDHPSKPTIETYKF